MNKPNGCSPSDCTHRIMTIITEFDWPARAKLTIKMNNIRNPESLVADSNGTLKTGTFIAYTKYDGTILDSTDLSDTS